MEFLLDFSKDFIISAPLTAGLGLLTAWLLVRQRFAGKDVFEFITMLALRFPGRSLELAIFSPLTYLRLKLQELESF